MQTHTHARPKDSASAGSQTHSQLNPRPFGLPGEQVAAPPASQFNPRPFPPEVYGQGSPQGPADLQTKPEVIGAGFEMLGPDQFAPPTSPAAPPVIPPNAGTLPNSTSPSLPGEEQSAQRPNLLEILVRNTQSAMTQQTTQQSAPQPTVQPSIQTKLTVGEPNDAYEQEADRVAAQVMSMAQPTPPSLQRQAEEDEIQAKPLAETITPIVQTKCEACEEEPIQRSADRTVPAQPDLETRLNTSKGGGSPLPDEVRGFMEPRFGTNFSQVRVHTDGEAVQMNRELGAQAFTHGAHIYYGAGKAPAKDELTGHELTHVVQQAKNHSSIQRQELFGRSRIGRTFRGNQTDRPEDWWNIDRLDWPNYMANPRANSFIRAVIFNTEHNNPQEFTTVSQRHDYYRVTDFLIQSGQMSPSVQGVRFFEAAGITTGALGVGGAVSSIGGQMTHSAETRQLLTDVNEILFEANMNVINRLNSRRQPTDPNNPNDRTPISTLVFDLGMVEMEQTRVEQFITANRHRMSATVVSEINSDLNSAGFLRTVAPIRPVQFAWARNLLGVTALDFQTRQHRVAIGKAMVFLLHGLSETQYQAYMNNGTLPQGTASP